MTILYIVRHGETDYNRDGRYQGQADIPLNDDGRRQSRAIAARLASIDFAAYYSSDLSRAMETARTIAGGHPVLPEVRLREVNVGRCYGMSNPEIALAYPEFWAAFQKDPDNVPFLGGESAVEVQKRGLEAIREICARHPEDKVCVTTHGGMLKMIVTDVAGMPLHARSLIVLDNCSLTVVEWSSTHRRLRSLNDTGHLEQAPRDVRADF